MWIFLIFLLCLAAGPCYGQQFKQEEVDTFLFRVRTNVWENLKRYGVSNFLDVDSETRFNKSLSGYDLKGLLYMEDGFVLDITGISTSTKDTHMIILGNSTMIKSSLELDNLAVLRDFRYEPQKEDNITDETTGTVIIQPKKYAFEYQVENNMRNKTIVASITSLMFSPGGDYLTFEPENGLTVRLKKIYGARLANQPDVMEGIYDLWKPIFQGFLEASVKEAPYPTLYFPTSRY